MFNMRTQSVNVSRLQLLSVLKTNLKQHLADYEKALQGYQLEVVETLEATLARVREGDFSKVTVSVQKPESHEQEFLDVIEMMEMSVDETINLDRDAFRAYIKNDWPWSQQFSAISASYIAKLAG